MRGLYALAVPGGVILLAAALFLRWAPAEHLGPVLHVAPYVILGAGLLLGWRFHRTSVIFVLLALALADRALLIQLGGVPVLTAAGRTVFHAVAVLLPLNLIAFSLVGDRGSLAGRFGFGFGVLTAQAATVAVLAGLAAPGAAALLEMKFLPPWLPGSASVAHPGLVSFALAAVFLGGRCLVQRKPLDHGMLWALAASYLALYHFIATPSGAALPALTFYFSTAGLILVVAVIEAGYAMAFRDELTRLPGRRALNEALGQTGEQYAVAMVDVDHFKKFNDTYGHDVGDQVLKMVAARLEEVTGGGRAFRYGGEEFSVLFAGKTVDDALPHLEAVRGAIERTRFTLRAAGRPRKKPGKARAPSGSKQVSVTVSIGVAEPSASAATSELVIKAADKALYRAKKGGRNQVRT